MNTPRTSIENHLGGWVMKHEYSMDGITFSERKQVTDLTTPENQDPVGKSKKMLIHTRRIGDQSYEVKQTIEGGEIVESTVNTTMSDSELAKFKRQWLECWCPIVAV